MPRRESESLEISMRGFFIAPQKNKLYRCLSGLIAGVLSLSLIFSPTTSYAQSINLLNLPIPGTMIAPSPAFVPVLLKGMTIHPDDPLKFDFIIDSGNTNFTADEIKSESERLVKYFLASMTVPKDDLWVNLSPYENDRIIPEELGKTELGRDMLAQDYILKQLTASLMHPGKELGERFWDKVYQKAEEQFGTSEIPVNTFNKVWILPENATVYEHEQTVYIVDAHLKVMLDSDYQAMQYEKAGDKSTAINSQDSSLELQSSIIKEIIIPEIEREVNEGQHFAPLRQIYHSLILAKWYKETIKNSLLSQVYVDQNKVAGVDIDDVTIKDQIYARYIEAYKKGVFNYIKEDHDRLSREIIPRKYFSGGITGDVEVERTNRAVQDSKTLNIATYRIAPQEFDQSSSPVKKDKDEEPPVDLESTTHRETDLTRPMMTGDFRAAILRVLKRLRNVGDLERLWGMSFPELMDAVGGREIKDPRYSSLTMNFAFYVSPKNYKRIEADRDAFRKQHGISDPLTLDDLYQQAPRIAYIAPEQAGPYEHLAKIHPEIMGPGIYYHRHASTRVEGIDDLKISILFHEMLEEEFLTYHLKDEIFEKWFHHAHPLLVVAEVYLSAFLGRKTLSLSLETYQRQIRGIEETRHPQPPDTRFEDVGTRKMLEQFDRVSQYNRAIGDAHAELEDPLRREKEDHLESLISALKNFLDAAESLGFGQQVRENLELETAGQPLPALPATFLPSSDLQPVTTELAVSQKSPSDQTLPAEKKKPLRILLVDHDEDRKAIIGILRELETRYATAIEVLSAKNPEEGWTIFNSSRVEGQQIDLVLTDYAFGGGMTGVELIKRIQDEEMIPTIMVTTWAPSYIREQISRTQATLHGLFEDRSISNPENLVATLVHLAGLDSFALARPYKPEKKFFKRFIRTVAQLKATPGASVSITRVGKLYEIMLIGSGRSLDKSLEQLMEAAWSSGQIAIGTNTEEGYGYSFLIDAELVDLASKVGAPQDQLETFEEALRRARIVRATKRKKLEGETGSSPVSSAEEVGGIDMNKIDVDRQGAGMNIQFDPVEIQEIIDMGITGFAPVIINLTPLPSVLPLLGLAPQKEEEFEVSSLN